MLTCKSYFNSPLGWMKIEANSDFVCRVVFLNVEPDVSLENPNVITRKCREELGLYFEGKLKVFTVPFAQHGTAFQQKVWNHLREIPHGATKTYKQMAQILGNEKVIRAAASANGKNALCILVPCHRVIGSDGSLVGYSGELWRKKALLELENQFSGKQLTLF